MTLWMVCVDGSNHANKAFHRCVKLVHKDSDTLLLVMISQPNKFVHSTRYAAAKQYMPASEVDAAEHAVERKSREVLLPYIAAAKEIGVENVQGVVGVGKHPGNAICAVAQKYNVDCLVLGRRGMGSLKRMMVGSTSDYVVQHSSVCVLVCPEATEDTPLPSVKGVDLSNVKISMHTIDSH